MPSPLPKIRYYFNWRGTYVHRVRNINHHHLGGEKYTHSAVHFACGNSGFISKDRPAKIYGTPPKYKPLCKKCFPCEQFRKEVGYGQGHDGNST